MPGRPKKVDIAKVKIFIGIIIFNDSKIILIPYKHTKAKHNFFAILIINFTNITSLII